MAKKIRLLVIFLCIVTGCVGQTTTQVTLTYYNPVKGQCDGNPLVTADGSKIKMDHLKTGKIRWCAVSRDLWTKFGCKYKGKPVHIWVEGFGEYEIHDKMNKRFSKRVDLLFHPKDSRKVFKKNVKIKKIQ